MIMNVKSRKLEELTYFQNYGRLLLHGTAVVCSSLCFDYSGSHMLLFTDQFYAKLVRDTKLQQLTLLLLILLCVQMFAISTLIIRITGSNYEGGFNKHLLSRFDKKYNHFMLLVQRFHFIIEGYLMSILMVKGHLMLSYSDRGFNYRSYDISYNCTMANLFRKDQRILD